MNKWFRNKELSWLSFNARILQEASDPGVPLMERLKFLGIFSSNLDEFFRIRVATLKRISLLGKKAKSIIGHRPKKILTEIQETVLRQHLVFDQIFQDISTELARKNIFIVNEKELDENQAVFVRSYFQRQVRPHLIPIMLDQIEHLPALRDQSTYLAVSLSRRKRPVVEKYALIEVPTHVCSRFLILPTVDKRRYVMLLDDVIRFCLDDIFSVFTFDRFKAFAVKLTRDAEIDFDDDFSQSYVKKLIKGLKKRKNGNPVRFVHDAKLPKSLFDILTKKLNLDRYDTLISGARYHNFRDFMDFPDFDLKQMKYKPVKSLPHPDFDPSKRLIDIIREKDVLLHYPYQSFDYIIDFLREAAIDPMVTSIKITVYRAVSESSVMNALINAARNGKAVTVVLELQARFDEEANLQWGDRLQEEGVRVIFGVPGLKVHSKLCLVSRKENRSTVYFGIVGTGNFNEDTARIYSDHSLFTADKKITNEISKVFSFYNNNYKTTSFQHLIVSPFNMRKKFNKLIRQEIKNAQSGKEAYIFLKLNNLVDPEIIKLLYEASESGVEVRLIVRSMFSLVTGLPRFSEKIKAVGIVDKYLEHTRIFVFANGGDPKYYISSADLMQRNLDRRVEVTCPVYDKAVREELRAFLDIQWRDNVKARVLDLDLENKINKNTADIGKIRAQREIYEYLKNRALTETAADIETPPAAKPAPSQAAVS